MPIHDLGRPLPAAAVLLSLLLAGCSYRASGNPEDSTPAAAQDSAPPEAVLVRVAGVRTGPIERRLEVTALVESLDVVDVVAERAEPVVELFVEEGDDVSAGQVLARLRPDLAALQVEEARVRHEEAGNRLEQARRDHERNRKLAEEGGTSLISDRELETSAQALLDAETALAAAKVALDQAKVELERCTIRAPIAGTITARDISVGDRTVLGGRVFQVTDLDHPRAIFHRPQRELAELRVGQRLVADSDALPGVEVPGRIERIAPVVDAGSGTVKVTAALEPPGSRLPTGILVRIRLVLDRHENALLLPKQALLYQGRSIYCFAVREDRAVRLDVVPGFEDPEWLEALPAENGPQPGDQIVVVGADRLADGDPVQLAAE